MLEKYMSLRAELENLVHTLLLPSPDTFCSTLNDLLEERDIGLLLSVVTLLNGLLAKNGPVGYESCQFRLIKILDRLTHVRERDIQAEYLYYAIPCPWLQVPLQ